MFDLVRPTPSASASSAARPALTPLPATAAPTATDVVERPAPGLARGVWEAPPWLFWAFLAVVVLGATAYLLRRLGILRLGRSGAGAGSESPPASSSASRGRRP